MKLFTTAIEMWYQKSGKNVEKGQILIFIKSTPLICQNEPRAEGEAEEIFLTSNSTEAGS